MPEEHQGGRHALADDDIVPENRGKPGPQDELVNRVAANKRRGRAVQLAEAGPGNPGE
jgi:hypothetical protein